jgi:hypothetical protein
VRVTCYQNLQATAKKAFFFDVLALPNLRFKNILIRKWNKFFGSATNAHQFGLKR